MALIGVTGPGTATVRLTGTKAWCCGANAVTHALVSCRDALGQPCLAAVALAQPDVRIRHNSWHVIGMAATHGVDVHFHDAMAQRFGKPSDHAHRSGFWHGRAGIAACWYGEAQDIADMVRAWSGGAASAASSTASGADGHPHGAPGRHRRGHGWRCRCAA